MSYIIHYKNRRHLWNSTNERGFCTRIPQVAKGYFITELSSGFMGIRRKTITGRRREKIEELLIEYSPKVVYDHLSHTRDHVSLGTIYNIRRQKTTRSEGIKAEQKPYEETSHKRTMRKLAKELAEKIKFPSFWDKDLWGNLPVEFKPGKYSLSIGVVEIDEDNQIEVNYHEIGPGIAEPHLLKGLYSHLSTSGLYRFVELVGDKGKLDNLKVELGQYSQMLLTFLKLIADDVKGYRAEVIFHDKAKPGLTKCFILTVWHDAFQKAGGYSWVDNLLYKKESLPGTGLWKLSRSAYNIGMAKSEKTLKTYENWHKKLKLKYAGHPLAKDIHAKDQELSIIAQDIRQRLQEFSDVERLPGHCELC